MLSPAPIKSLLADKRLFDSLMQKAFPENPNRYKHFTTNMADANCVVIISCLEQKIGQKVKWIALRPLQAKGIRIKTLDLQ